MLHALLQSDSEHVSRATQNSGHLGGEGSSGEGGEGGEGGGGSGGGGGGVRSSQREAASRASPSRRAVEPRQAAPSRRVAESRRAPSPASELIWHPIQTPCGALRATRAARHTRQEVSTEGKYGGQKCGASPRLRLGDHLCIRVEAPAAAELVAERSRDLQAIKKSRRPVARSGTNVVVLNFQFAIWGGGWRSRLFSGGKSTTAASVRPVRAHLMPPTFSGC